MTTILLAIAAAASSGCLQPSADRIRAADLAVAVPAFASLPPETVISHSPQPGYTRVFPPAELMQWLGRYGITTPVTGGLCFAWNLQEPDPAAIMAAMLRSLPEGSHVEVLETSRFPVPAGEIVFDRAGLRSGPSGQPYTWHGHVRYAGARRADLWAKVDLRIPITRVIAAVDIPSGLVLQASMLRIENTSGPPPPGHILTTPDQALNRVTRRHIPAGTPVSPAMLGPRQAIRRGEPLHVSVTSGAARLGFDTVAEAAAAEGEDVPVRVPVSGRIVRVRVLPGGQAELKLSAGGGVR